jgi:hypothetical protein
MINVTEHFVSNALVRTRLTKTFNERTEPHATNNLMNWPCLSSRSCSKASELNKQLPSAGTAKVSNSFEGMKEWNLFEYIEQQRLRSVHANSL